MLKGLFLCRRSVLLAPRLRIAHGKSFRPSTTATFFYCCCYHRHHHHQTSQSHASTSSSSSWLLRASRRYLHCCQNLRAYGSVGGSEKSYDFDLIVIGGGSGGLACAKEASEIGRRVAVLDFVKPSVHGSQWGLGGTCVNVGCIPKKLMHHAALLGAAIKDAKSYGWQIDDNPTHDWRQLRGAIQGHIKSLNFGHRVQLNDRAVKYYNAMASFVDKHKISAKMKNGKEEMISGANVVIATGLRPKYPTIPGSELGISSDDVFSLKDPPGKTLVVGASYVALECAGLLNGLGYPVTTMIRSIPLRGFDQQMAKLITDHMAAEGTRFIWKSTPERVERRGNGKLLVHWRSSERTEVAQEEFDTVLWAIGRVPTVSNLNLENAGVKVDPGSGFIPVDSEERTNVPHVFALGDIQHDRPELTPVAVQAGRLLANRLFSHNYALMDYEKIPTTVFTPLEYGCVGIAEEEGVSRFGADKIDVYHAFYRPLEYNLQHRRAEECYIKAVVRRDDPRTVLGLHFLGPNAGEVIQGFATAMRCGMTMDDLKMTVGIHPTCAEEIVKLKITKRSSKDPTVTGC